MKTNIKRLKLAKLLLKFRELITDKETLIYEGDLVEGLEVFVEKEGEMIPAPNGDYKTDDVVITIEDGKVVKIVEVEVEEEIEDEVVDERDEKDEKIKELESKIIELEAIIAERDARIAELETIITEKDEQLQMSSQKPVHKEIKDIIISNKENKVLKYFK